jgi:hypothetical protein
VLAVLRGPGESLSDVILRLVESATGKLFLFRDMAASAAMIALRAKWRRRRC